MHDEIAAVADLAEKVDVDVALDKVELSQGSEGRASWRLVADPTEWIVRGEFPPASSMIAHRRIGPHPDANP